tara:strand:- start:7710 stop:7940 length:231 start_codon:yes stop_codon:yes gene_type:complete
VYITFNHKERIKYMASNEKWKSVSVDIKTYKQLKKIAVDEDRKVGQQITNLVKKEYESRYGSEIKDMGIGSAKQMQ